MSEESQNSLIGTENNDFSVDHGEMRSSLFAEGDTYRQDWEYGFEDESDCREHECKQSL